MKLIGKEYQFQARAIGQVAMQILSWLALATLMITPSSAQSPSELAKDLDLLAEQLPRKHKNLFAYQSQDLFEQRIAELRTKLPSLDALRFRLELARLITSVGDGHTRLQMDLTEMRFYPINVHWFDDQLAVIAAGPDESDLLGAEILSINGLPIAEVLERLREFHPHDNEFSYRHQIDNQFNNATLLAYACGFEDPHSAEFVCRKEGQDLKRNLSALPLEEVKQLKWKFVAKLPRYAQKSNLDFWNDWLPELKAVYFKYNRCQAPAAFQKLVQGTQGFIAQNPVERFVLDLRHNGGGDSSVFRPLYQYLRDHPKLNQRGKLYVIVGRGTFSSGLWAAYDMKKLNAVIVGEPTGGKPNHYGEVKSFELPNSKTTVFYSTKYWKLVEGEDPEALMPDLRVKSLAADYFLGQDPALNAVQNDFNRK